jgi:hypothetical protein
MKNTTNVERLKELLAQINNPTTVEFNQITSEFNKFKKRHNPNNSTVSFSFSKMFYLLNLCYEDFIRLQVLLDSILDGKLRPAINGFLIGSFYEMVITIRRNDIFGYVRSGFDLTEEEFEVMEGYRNQIFHIPENEDVFVRRSMKFINWETVVKRIKENTNALVRYISFIKLNYSLFVDDEISKWKVKVNITNPEILERYADLLPLPMVRGENEVVD